MRHLHPSGPLSGITGLRTAVRDFVRFNAPLAARRISTFHLSEDRVVLETKILTQLRDDRAIQRILFVGCDWYTKAYESIFSNKDYWTIEIDPRKRHFGARRHIVDALCNLGDYCPANYFDAIVCNGVFMRTAIETFEEAEASFTACRRCLRPNGWFVLGWNNTDELRPYPPSESPTLATFQRAPFPGLGVAEYTTETSYRHVFSFFRMP